MQCVSIQKKLTLLPKVSHFKLVTVPTKETVPLRVCDARTEDREHPTHVGTTRRGEPDSTGTTTTDGTNCERRLRLHNYRTCVVDDLFQNYKDDLLRGRTQYRYPFLVHLINFLRVRTREVGR